MSAGMGWVSVPDETLVVGDTINLPGTFGVVRINKIVSYPSDGPLADIIFATAETEPGRGISLELGGYTERLQAPEAVTP